MKKTGFRVDVSTLRKKLEAMKQVAAIQFKPDVMDYTKKDAGDGFADYSRS